MVPVKNEKEQWAGSQQGGLCKGVCGMRGVRNKNGLGSVKPVKEGVSSAEAKEAKRAEAELQP